MPTATDITLADSAAANHVFEPLSISPGNSVLVNHDAETIAGQEQLILQLDPANTRRPTAHVGIRLNVPTEVLVDNSYVVTDVARCDIKVIIPTSLTQTQRADFAALIKNALANSIIEGYISEQKPLY